MIVHPKYSGAWSLGPDSKADKLRDFLSRVVETLRASHGDEFAISMRDHQRKIILKNSDGDIVAEYQDSGTI